MMTLAQINRVWAFLIGLTAAAVALTFFILDKQIFIAVVILATAIKGQQIVDFFMELAHAPKGWRKIFLSYVIGLPLLLMAIYLF